MKKKITILFIALLATQLLLAATYGESCSNCGYHVYKKYDGNNWNWAGEFLRKSGNVNSVTLKAEPSVTDDGVVTFSGIVKFQDWQTYMRESATYGYVARYCSFDITLEFTLGSETTTKTDTYKLSPEINGDWSGADSDYYLKEREYPFSYDFKLTDFYKSPNNKKITCSVKATVLPSKNVSVSDEPGYGIHYQNKWGYKTTNCFINGITLTDNKTKQSSTVTVEYDKGTHSIKVNNSAINPKVGNYYLIYNNPNAKVSMSLNSDAKKNKTIAGIYHYGYSAFTKKVNGETKFSVINNNINKLNSISDENSSIIYTKEYFLKDLGTNEDGKIIQVAHRLVYDNKSTTPSSSNMLLPLNNLILESNYINYKVVPTVQFPKFTEQEKKTIYKCYSNENINDINYIVGFNDKYLTTTTNNIVDITAYSPEYQWLYSTDNSTWKTIEDIYINNANVGLSNNLQIRSKILQGRNTVYFKQKAILKAFSSDTKSDLYTEYIDGKYYIAVESEKYTLAKMPTPTNNNFGIDSGNNYISGDSYEKVLLNSKPYNGKRVSFRFVVYNLASDVYTALNRIANKTITITKNDGSKEIINGNTYLIQDYQKGEWKFDCKIEFCNGTSIGKSFTINSYPGIFFSTNSNEKNIYKLYSKDIKNNDERYIISLISDKITTTNQYLTEEDLKTEYLWEFSYDKKTWQKIDEKYIINPTVIIGKGDTHISSTLLGDKSEVYVRQKAILKGFSQNTENSTFNELINGKYYIGETSDIYTIKKLPNITNDNITFTSGAGYASKDMITCYDNVDSYNGLNIEFNVTADANITEEELEAIRNNATYSIKRTKITFDGNSVVEDVTKTLTPNKHIVTGFTSGVEEMKYTCTVTYNGVDFVKTLTLKSYPEEKIDINKIEAQTNGASIVSRDIANMNLQAVCPKGEEFKIKYYLADSIRPNIGAYESKIEYTCPEYPEMVPYEDIVPFVPYPEMVPYPEYVAPNFDAMGRSELVDYLNSKGYDYEQDNMGQILDESTASQIRAYLKTKDPLVYKADKLAYEQQYEADKLAYEQQYEADKQAYIDDYNTKKAEFEAGCAAKITWQEFDDNLNYTTTLENITENKNNAVFYMRTKSTDDNGGCYSGVVTINVTYIDGISNNLIEFVGDEYKGKDSIIVTAGEGNPAIKGELVEGGFGIPKDDADCIYSYTWKYYNEALSTWEKLIDDNGNELMFDEFNTNDGNRAEIRNVSLESDILKNAIASNPKGLKIARFVSSYKINQMSSKMEYMSNVLVISSSKLIEDDKFTYEKSDKFCPGAGSVNILFTDVELEENEVLDVKVLEKDQEDLEKVFNYEKRIVSIVNPYKDFNVSICRRDTITNVKSNDVVLEIDIPEFKADFMVSVDYIDHELTEDRINVQSGSRVKLINTTVDEIGGTLYNWTLQVQKDGLLAQPSEKESPVCYLYNPGLNQIRLEVINANKCKSVVTADNIFVTGLPDNRSSSFFADDEANEQMLATESYIRVFPTILIDENIVNVQSNIERYDVVITDVAGKVMLVAENLTMSSTLDLAFLPNGIYILNASGNAFKLIKK